MFNIISLSGIINNVVATEKILTGSGTRWIGKQKGQYR
jgi:hypothetical protein